MPNADPLDCKIYMFGFYLACCGEHHDNLMEKIAIKLRISVDRIMEGYNYWELQGLVTIEKSDPVTISYHCVKQPIRPIIKLNAAKYSEFVDEFRRLFDKDDASQLADGNVVSHNDLIPLIELMENYKIETSAMLMIVKFCLQRYPKANISTIYSFSANWASQGITTVSAVDERLTDIELNGENLRSIFSTLGLRSAPNVDDLQSYQKWYKEYGYGLDAILTAARALKRRGGMKGLTKIMEELHNAGIYRADEISAYMKARIDNRTLAADIVKSVGSYYLDLDMVLETYITPWLTKGFDEAAIRAIAKYCFERSIRGLSGINNIVNSFYKKAIFTASAILSFVERELRIDELIAEVLSAAADSSPVSYNDRKLYRTFIETWEFDHEIVLAVAKTAMGFPYTMTYVSKTLAELKKNNLHALSDVEKYLADREKTRSNTFSTKKTSRPKVGNDEHIYTEEEFNAIFTNIDDLIVGLTDEDL
jgi:hypothetical protein